MTYTVWWDVKPCSINQSTTVINEDYYYIIKLATLTYKLLYNQAPSYLTPVVRVANASGRRALRSANTDRLMVPHVRLSSVGNRAFPVGAHGVWNSLPSEVTSAQSLHSFRRHLKTFLFQRSFPDVIVTL